MRITIFFKTFIMLLISFSVVFLLSIYISYQQFSPMYIEENIQAVKDSIIVSAPQLASGTLLENTSLDDLSSETTFIRYQNNTITQQIGPNYLAEEDILDFVIGIYDSPETIKEGKLVYYTDIVEDVYTINYIYEFTIGDYLIISTRIQSLTNIDKVLNNINMYQSIALFMVITIISFIISRNISKPLKMINQYAKNISNLQFDESLQIKRKDEFQELVSSLNEMTFNLQKSYMELSSANDRLHNTLEFEKHQEEQKKQLIMTINHELKTPLSVMKGMIEGMIDGVGRYKDKEKYLTELINQIETIEHITQDLTYSLRLEDKAKPGDTASTSQLQESLKPLIELARKKYIKVSLQIEDATLLINEELLNILIMNLVKNAIIYSKDDMVHVQGKKTDELYTFTIRNKGEIQKEDLQKIFESFYRADTLNVNKSGSGLGLFIVKQICDIYQYNYKIFNDNSYVTAKVTLKIQN